MTSKWQKWQKWRDEPSQVVFEAEGLLCVAHREEKLGHWCGYVGVEKSKVPQDTAELLVHGGITWESKKLPSTIDYTSGDSLYWLGFDCAHAGDLKPRDTATYTRWNKYRGVGYVIRECVRLARQLQGKAQDDGEHL